MKLQVALFASCLVGSTAYTPGGPVKAKAPQSRRDLLKGLPFLAAGVAASAANAYDLPDLPYAFDALEPYIDAPTMKIHHDMHHNTYVTNINNAMKDKPAVDIRDLQTDALTAAPGVRNSGGGHYNHAFFWDEMAPHDKAKNTKPSAKLQGMIDSAFGGTEKMKEEWAAKSAPGAVFGSGWVWLVVNGKDELEIVGTPNQDNPLMKGVKDEIKYPILGVDVWEHAYYLKYQNRRPEYVANWWNVVNWDKVNENLDYVLKEHKGVPVRG